MYIQQIPHASLLYEASKRFREEILRLPIGLKLSEKDIEGENMQLHIAAVENEDIVGIVLLKPLSPERVKLRQMAVSTHLQKAGVGKKLVLFAEALARAKHFHIIEANARVYAQGFYEKLGYQATGETFIEVTLPTIKMVKTL